MPVVDIWNAIETAVTKIGFVMSDVDDEPQSRRYTIRIVEIPGDQNLRGSIGSGIVRLVFAIEVMLIYAVGNDKRIERKIAEDAELVVASIYGGANMTNHHFVGGSIQRDPIKGIVTNSLRFDFQSQVTL